MSKLADDIFKEKIDFLLKAEQGLDIKVIEHQKAIYELLVSEYLPLFDVKDGILLDTPNNDNILNKLDTYINRLNKALYKDVLGDFTKSLLQSVNLSVEYYVALGFKKSIVSKILNDKIRLEKKLGITPKGTLRKDSYLYNLGNTNEVRQKLKTYILNSLTSDVSFFDFQLGFRNLVLGNKKTKGLDTKGVYQKYFDQYAYDSFNQVDAMANKQFANELNLKHFIYEGSLINTSRAFCKKRAGKAFTVAETKKWKNDPTLIDKKNKSTYRPLIERGRYRCRHFIKYITEEMYKHLKGIK